MGAVISGLLTVTVTVEVVVALSAASRARAATVWVPLLTAVVFHDTL